VTECDDLRAPGHHFTQSIEIHTPVARELADSELCPALDGELLPRDKIRVMLEGRDEDFVAGLHVVRPHADATRLIDSVVPRREDETVGVGDSKKSRDARPCFVISLGRGHWRAHTLLDEDLRCSSHRIQ
jgi:hypothetical protein